MKIDINSLQTTSTQAREVSKRSADNAQSTNSAVSAGSERVSLSGDARLLNQLQSIVAGQPDLDQSRVEGIKARIEAGTYHVDPDKLVSSFLELESLLD